MPYEVLEKQIKALPESYYTELVHYISFLTQKVLAEKDVQEDESLAKMRESSLATVWEYLKDDTW